MGFYGGFSRQYFVCVEHRQLSRVFSACPVGSEPMMGMSPNWRPPRKNNESAWKEMANGNMYWDQKAKDKATHYTPRHPLMRSVRGERKLTKTERGLAKPSVPRYSWWKAQDRELQRLSKEETNA